MVGESEYPEEEENMQRGGEKWQEIRRKKIQ